MEHRLRELREENDFTQQKVAEYLKCDQSLYSKYERKEREAPIHILIKLAHLYKTSIDYLVCLTDDKKTI